MSEEHALHSSGDVAKATGISVDTVRVWERRYGRPESIRLPSGHRRYTDEHIRWLRRVAEALARGHRPAKVIGMSESDLDLLLAPKAGEPEPKFLGTLLELIRESKTHELRSSLTSLAKGLKPLDFLNRCVSPLIFAVGRGWADGNLGVRHEHFCSEVLEDFLRAYRDGLPESDEGPLLVLATLPDETHDLGLQMAAVVARAAGTRVLLLGTNTPLEEIAAAAEEEKAVAVAVSVSLATGGPATDRSLADLRTLIPERIRLIIGGRGARGIRRGPRGIDYAENFEAFHSFLAGLSRMRRHR
jgi:MerR family transcriptional regulator, light-induced transcriptional regulator